jgi:hypothetical protein
MPLDELSQISASLMLCDSVEAIANKLYILGGGWDSIGAQALPFRQARIGLAITIRVPWTETDVPHSARIRLEDADGRPLAIGPEPKADSHAIEAQFNVGRPPTIRPGDQQSLHVAINLDQQFFGTGGQYNFVVEIDGQERARQVFRVIPAS